MKELQQNPALGDCPLAGGTALALQLGHRISLDLDFFSSRDLNLNEIKKVFESYPTAKELATSKNILTWSINDVKIDVVNYTYPTLRPLIENSGIVLYSMEDIAAMKLEAIKGRGRKRDFYDLYFLLKKFDLAKMLQFNKEKYNRSNMFMVIKSMTFFEDANTDPDVMVPKDTEKVDWELVKKEIIKAVKSI